MKRIKVTDEELAILEGLRHEKAIWNQALEAAVLAVARTPGAHDVGDYAVSRELASENILALRKE